MAGAASYPEGFDPLVTDPEQRLLVKWCAALFNEHGNVGDVPFPEGVQPLTTDNEERLLIKIAAINAAIA